MGDDRTVYPAAPGAYFEAGGRSYFLPRLAQDDKAAFHAWANARALADVRQLEALCCKPWEQPSPEHPLAFAEYAYALSTTVTNVGAGHYAYHEPGGWARRRTLEGTAYLCWLAMRRAGPSVTWAEVWAVAQVFEEKLRAAFDEANADPNPPGRATGPAPATSGTGAIFTPSSPNASASPQPSGAG